jgi:hypothetical protein
MQILLRILPQVSLVLETHYFFLLLVTAWPVYNVLSFSSVSQDVIIFSILNSILKFCERSIADQLFHKPGIDTDPDRHVLDSNPYRDPEK